VASEKLPQETLHPVAATSFAHLTPRHQPQSGASPLPRGQTDAEMGSIESFAPGLGPEVFPAAAEPLVPGKAGRVRGCVIGGLSGVRQ
jgi:hypothetical protein